MTLRDHPRMPFKGSRPPLGTTKELRQYLRMLKTNGIAFTLDREAGTVDTTAADGFPFRVIQKGDRGAPWIMRFTNTDQIIWIFPED